MSLNFNNKNANNIYLRDKNISKIFLREKEKLILENLSSEECSFSNIRIEEV